METSKSISLLIAKLKVAYPSYFRNLSSEDLLQLISMYQDSLGSYNNQVLEEATKTIIKTKKYMPTIAEIIEICDSTKVIVRNEIIEFMIKDGYFKNQREIEKTYNWLEKGIIPSWLKNDMYKYYSKMNDCNKLLESK